MFPHKLSLESKFLSFKRSRSARTPFSEFIFLPLFHRDMSKSFTVKKIHRKNSQMWQSTQKSELKICTIGLLRLLYEQRIRSYSGSQLPISSQR